MRQWISHTDSFRHAIWSKLDIANSENEDDNHNINMNNTAPTTIHIPIESFRIFGFVNDNGFRTNAPGRDTRRRLGYTEDVQRVFYSGHFAGHGLKVQAITLINGLFSNIFVALLRVSDTALQNMSGLDFYLTRLFMEFNRSRESITRSIWRWCFSTVGNYSSKVH